MLEDIGHFCGTWIPVEFCLEPHPGFYRLLMKGIFDVYVL